ncbi:hypothetical protein C8R46DRAFT_1006412 [Mycena filopes]|nr:hypothetical protein C8R46DRAFT_1006412 [Mycena filopes]
MIYPCSSLEHLELLESAPSFAFVQDRRRKGQDEMATYRTQAVIEPLRSVSGHIAIVKWSPSRSEFSTSTQNRVLVHGAGAIRYLVEEYTHLPANATLDESESCALRIIVAPDLLPVTRLKTAEDLAAALRGIFKGYRRLYETTGRLHRDIAAANTRFYRDRQGQVCGVLRDFDCGVPSDQSMAKHRTNTIVYMAMDLLVPAVQPPNHLYRHDLESFLYVLAFLTVNTKVGSGKLLKTWANLPVSSLRAEKNLAITTDRFPDPYVEFVDLWLGWLTPLTNMFGEGLRLAREYRDAFRLAQHRKIAPPPPFANDTLGGVVTFEKFAAILDAPFEYATPETPSE